MLRPQSFGFSVLLFVLALLRDVGGDADFESVRSRMTKDSSGKRGDPKAKYWHESTFHPHYDGRFASKPLSYDDQKTNLSMLMESYLSTMSDLGAETWIMHGTLMGWWWNRKILPWDSDVDVQVSAYTIHFLASYYNMTIHRFKGRSYMLEINPGYVNGSAADWLNMIDGRYIDMDKGLFIDMTTVRRKEGSTGKLTCKDKHDYEEADIFPLRDSVFENKPVKIPYNYAWLLEEEYGKASLTKTAFQGHVFNSGAMEWERMK
ncbi:hypothetical protein MMC22_011602 [Lobaria immixta]|nr:hypothetical protein [Lobaria immixta]